MTYKVCTWIVTLCIFGTTLFGLFYALLPSNEGYLSHCGIDTVVVVPIYGDIAWGVGDTEASVYGAGVAEILQEIRDTGFYNGLILDIDSPGGYPVASDRLAELVRSLQVPTTAIIGDVGTSGGYLLAASADYVFAHPISDVGSIGVTASYVSEASANTAQGYEYEELTTGTFKDTGNPAKDLSDEERSFIMNNLAGAHDFFVERVAEYRDMSIDEARALADGKWYAGAEAVENGLIDSVGGLDDAHQYIVEATGREVSLCTAPTL